MKFAAVLVFSIGCGSHTEPGSSQSESRATEGHAREPAKAGKRGGGGGECVQQRGRWCDGDVVKKCEDGRAVKIEDCDDSNTSCIGPGGPSEAAEQASCQTLRGGDCRPLDAVCQTTDLMTCREGHFVVVNGQCACDEDLSKPGHPRATCID